MLVLGPEQYFKIGLVDEMRRTGQDRGYCKLIVKDNKAITMPTRNAVFNIIYWEPLILFNIQPSIKETFNIKSISSDSSSKVYSIIYDRFLEDCPDTPHMLMVHAIFKNISRMYNFIVSECAEYMPSIDALSLATLLNEPKIKELASHVYDSSFGTSVAEAQLKQDGKELIKIIKDPKTSNNILYNYIQSGVLKANQIPQMLLAYGCRSDIDDTIHPHVISESSFSGLKSPADFAIESLSAKKSIFFSRDGIRKTQYSARKMRLMCSTIEKVYPGSCGSTTSVIPFVIKPEHASNFLNKVIIDDGKRVHLSSQAIIDSYVGKPIMLVSQFGCNHTDGLCEACAGYGKDRLLKYLSPGIHIGLLAASKTSSIVSQKVLSTKHLITTNSKIYNLPGNTSSYFHKDINTIYWNEKWAKQLKHYQIRIPMDALGPIVDLSLDVLPIAESFSRVSYFELLQDGNLIDTIPLEYDAFIPYLSTAFLTHMKRNYDNLTIEEDSIIVPMKGFDAKQEMFKFIILNDDMIAYTNSVNTFLTATIGNYTSVSHALSDFADTVWHKSSINIFFLETILHNMIITDDVSHQLCRVTDPNHVMFGKMDSIISNRTVSMKLAFERLKDYLNSPQTSNIARPVGLFGNFFGIV